MRRKSEKKVCTYCIQNCCICRSSGSTVSENAGIESRTVAKLDSAVRRTT